MVSLKEYLNHLIKNKVIPGISILVADGKRILLNYQEGYKSLFPDKTILKDNTLYDVASLTKPLITSLLILKLVELEKISLDDEVIKYIKGINKKIKIIDLLTHSSGYPDWYPLYIEKRSYLEVLKEMELKARPKKRVRYSCLGYILLYYIIEAIAKQKFEFLAEELIIHKLKLKSTFLGGIKNVRKCQQEIAPTEHGNNYEKNKALIVNVTKAQTFKWRREIIGGQTHDGNSFYLGGTAGNAGLFSNCRDLLTLSNEIYPELTTILKPETAQLYWKNYTPAKRSYRTAGFKLNTCITTLEGRPLKKPAVGHNGFTGCSIWCEQESKKRYIILSNRVHPQVREKPAFNKIRKKIHKLLKRAGY